MRTPKTVQKGEKSGPAGAGLPSDDSALMTTSLVVTMSVFSGGTSTASEGEGRAGESSSDRLGVASLSVSARLWVSLRPPGAAPMYAMCMQPPGPGTPKGHCHGEDRLARPTHSLHLLPLSTEQRTGRGATSRSETGTLGHF